MHVPSVSKIVGQIIIPKHTTFKFTQSFDTNATF